MEYIMIPDLGKIGKTRVLSWNAAEGDTVAEGEELVELEAEKTTFSIEAPCNGVLKQLFVDEGQPVQAGDKLGSIQPPE